MLKAIVIFLNDKTRDYSDLLAIARSCAKAREHSNENIPVRSIIYCAELGIHIAVYEVQGENSLPQHAKTVKPCSTRQRETRHV